MSEGKQGQDQLSALFSQRFKDREGAPTEERVMEKALRRPGRPEKAIKRKTVSFFLQPRVAERLDDAYFAWNGAGKRFGAARGDPRRGTACG